LSEKITIAFSGTKEQEEQLMKAIAEHKGQDGALIPVLHGAHALCHGVLISAGILRMVLSLSLRESGQV